MPRGRTGTTGYYAILHLRDTWFQCLVGGRERPSGEFRTISYSEFQCLVGGRERLTELETRDWIREFQCLVGGRERPGRAKEAGRSGSFNASWADGNDHSPEPAGDAGNLFQCLVGGRERLQAELNKNQPTKVSMPRGRTGTTRQSL